MPNRVLREGILTSERVNSLKWDEEVFYRRLMSVVDDFGRYTAHPKLLRAALYALCLDRVSDADVGKWMLATAEAGLVSVYTARDGKAYLELADFRQQVRAAKSRYPGPPNAEHVQGSREADALQAHGRCAADAQQMRSESETESETEAEACGTRAHAQGAVTEAVCREWTADRYAEDLRGLRPEYGRVDAGAILQALSTETDREQRARAYCQWRVADLGSVDADRKPVRTLISYLRNARRFAAGGAQTSGTCDPSTDTREVV